MVLALQIWLSLIGTLIALAVLIGVISEQTRKSQSRWYFQSPKSKASGVAANQATYSKSGRLRRKAA